MSTKTKFIGNKFINQVNVWKELTCRFWNVSGSTIFLGKGRKSLTQNVGKWELIIKLIFGH